MVTVPSALAVRIDQDFTPPSIVGVMADTAPSALESVVSAPSRMSASWATQVRAKRWLSSSGYMSARRPDASTISARASGE